MKLIVQLVRCSLYLDKLYCKLIPEQKDWSKYGIEKSGWISYKSCPPPNYLPYSHALFHTCTNILRYVSHTKRWSDEEWREVVALLSFLKKIFFRQPRLTAQSEFSRVGEMFSRLGADDELSGLRERGRDGARGRGRERVTL